MEVLFTAAAERAMGEAAAWSTFDGSTELEAPAILLGLLAESECRAAMILARHAIDAPTVVRRWPTLARREARFPAWGGSNALPRSSPEGGVPIRRFSAGVEVSLAAARRRLFDYPRPLILATEHILLGLADADHEVAVWLRQQGLDPDVIEAEIHQHYGHVRDPRADEMGPPVDFPADDEGGMASLASPCTPASQSPGVAAPGLFNTDQIHSLRVIDAAGNRAREGLRVVEDYLRFVLDDRFLTGQLKDLRHELAAVLSRFPLGERLAARETQADVGTAITTGAERRRDEIGQVLAANFTRLQEALRSLEEFAKLLDADASDRLKQLRYRTYTLQRAVELTRASLSRLAAARLYVLLDGRASLDEFKTLAHSLVEAGVHVIQLRDKRLDDRQLLERAAALREITRAAGVLFIMNDRPDLAAIAQADGVHVGQGDVSVKAVRTIVGPDALVGVSTHSIEQARQAVLDGANYIGVGPTFPSDTKHFDQFPGLDLLRAVAAEIRLPAFAIGGISPGNVADVLQTGIRRIAVSGAVLGAADPAATARHLSQQLTARQ
jgi:thiamine-phosphate pyrophosphorylase